MDSLNKAKKAEDIDQVAIAKMLANVKSLQKDVNMLAMAAAKNSAFGIVRIDGDGDDAKPVAFTLSRQSNALPSWLNVRELARELKKKKGAYRKYQYS